MTAEEEQFVEQLKARIDRGNALRATADGRVSELEIALENTIASAKGRGERALAAESNYRALLGSLREVVYKWERISETDILKELRAIIGAYRRDEVP